MPTPDAEFVLGQPVVLSLDGQGCYSTITARWFDPDANGWFYEVAGLANCEIAAHELHPVED
jgi:hypothetical protein